MIVFYGPLLCLFDHPNERESVEQTHENKSKPSRARSFVMFFSCASFYSSPLSFVPTVPPPISSSFASRHSRSTTPSPT